MAIVSESPRETPGDALRESLPVPDNEPCAPLAVRLLPIGSTVVLPSAVPVGGPEGAIPACPGGVELCMVVFIGVRNGGNERDVSARCAQSSCGLLLRIANPRRAWCYVTQGASTPRACV